MYSEFCSDRNAQLVFVDKNSPQAKFFMRCYKISVLYRSVPVELEGTNTGVVVDSHTVGWDHTVNSLGDLIPVQ